MFKLSESFFTGCFYVQPSILEDSRGSFVKIFHHEAFGRYGLNTNWQEEYYSTSKQGVLRGMHFQRPPHDHAKLVYCSLGEVMDVVVDLRKDSSTFGLAATFLISASKANMVYIPKGMAHGFYVISHAVTMHYMVETAYAPEFDSGILWSSVGVEWPVDNPLLSMRDRAFSPLNKFQTPFFC